MNENKKKVIVDARGVFCPIPLMELIKAIKQANVGDIVIVYSSDSGSKIDIPNWVERNGHKLVSVNEKEGYIEFIVEKQK